MINELFPLKEQLVIIELLLTLNVGRLYLSNPLHVNVVDVHVILDILLEGLDAADTIISFNVNGVIITIISNVVINAMLLIIPFFIIFSLIDIYMILQLTKAFLI